MRAPIFHAEVFWDDLRKTLIYMWCPGTPCQVLPIAW